MLTLLGDFGDRDLMATYREAIAESIGKPIDTPVRRKTMKMSLKYIFFIASILALLSSALVADESTDESHSMAVLADTSAININQASVPQIAVGLKGVGMVTATAIVTYRDANGPFKTKDTLIDVKGVCERTLIKNDEVIALE